MTVSPPLYVKSIYPAPAFVISSGNEAGVTEGCVKKVGSSIVAESTVCNINRPENVPPLLDSRKC